MNYKSSFEEVWQARRDIFSMCHNNPKELIEYYISLQNKNKTNNLIIDKVNNERSKEVILE
jgi:hypothetical protein